MRNEFDFIRNIKDKYGLMRVGDDCADTPHVGGVARSIESFVAQYRAQGHRVLVIAPEYPGYGKSGGWPVEAACHAATDAAFAWLTDAKGFAPGEVVLFGESLGGGVASKLATEHPVRGLVMCCTYTTMPDAAAHRYWWLPCLMRFSTFISRKCRRSSASPRAAQDGCPKENNVARSSMVLLSASVTGPPELTCSTICHFPNSCRNPMCVNLR